MENQDEKVAEYLPFHAINEFMRDDYRLSVIHEVLTHFEELSGEQRKEISQEITRQVKIAGFRNSNLAPAAIKAKNSVSLFQKSAKFSAVVVGAWSGLHPELATAVWQVLSEHGWEPQPVELNRAKLPGYQVKWPKKDTFEVLQQEARKTNSTLTETDDDISLMVVWLGNRLPYDLFLEGEEEKAG